MKEMKNRKDIPELRIWEVIKTAKKMEEFKIEKKDLKWNLLRGRIRFVDDLGKQEVETIKATMKKSK